MKSNKELLKRNQHALDKQRRTDRQFVIKNRRVAQNWQDYCQERFGERPTDRALWKGDPFPNLSPAASADADEAGRNERREDYETLPDITRRRVADAHAGMGG